MHAAAPDLIAVTGDFVEHKTSEVERNIPFLKALAGLVPVYAVSGNQDHWRDWPYIAGQLKETRVNVLENEHIRISRGGSVIILAGVSDPATGHGDLARALPEEAGNVTVLLAHAPTWFLPDYREKP